MKRLLLTVLMSLCVGSPWATESLLQKMQSLQSSLNPKLQGLYLSSKMRSVHSSYLQWLKTIPNHQFLAHLEVSHFGNLLIGRLMAHPSGNRNLRQRYIELVSHQIESMLQVIRRYTRQLAFDDSIYAQVQPFVQRYHDSYQSFMDQNMSLQKFQAAEHEIQADIQKLAQDPLTLDFMRILIFLEFQVMEYGSEVQ